MPRARKTAQTPPGDDPQRAKETAQGSAVAKPSRAKKTAQPPPGDEPQRAKETAQAPAVAKPSRAKKTAETAPAAKPSRAKKTAQASPDAEPTPDAEPPLNAEPSPDAESLPAKPRKPRSEATAPIATEPVVPKVASASQAASARFPATNYALVERLLVGFVAREVGKVGLSRVVLGLSGGVDSAVSAAIAARALGGANVLGVLMPYKSSSPESEEDARAVAEALQIETLLVDISAQVDTYFDRFPDASRLRRGNKMARERMTVLYDQSAARSALVIGTSNKTELLLGYGTLYGDMASALNPIGDLYKTQVWGLARHLGLPSSVIEKAPTADLWAGQTDENELGFSYHEVDRLLYWMIDERCAQDELEAMGFEAGFIERIARMVRSSQFKRRLPVIAKISARTVDPDFRYSRDWGL
ncbi:MAG: NAD+ synthase [Deltaproteobacteria bacterium]|nr:NAD+ synthase [Deltaproteobacteria bacterium]